MLNGIKNRSNQKLNCVCVCVCLSMDGVPLKMPQGASQQVKEDIKVIVPDYLTILQETEVTVSLLCPCVCVYIVCDTQTLLFVCAPFPTTTLLLITVLTFFIILQAEQTNNSSLFELICVSVHILI